MVLAESQDKHSTCQAVQHKERITRKLLMHWEHLRCQSKLTMRLYSESVTLSMKIGHHLWILAVLMPAQRGLVY